MDIVIKFRNMVISYANKLGLQIHVKIWAFPSYRSADHPTGGPSSKTAVLVFLSKLLRNVLKQMKNVNKKCPIFFSSYRENSLKIVHILNTKMNKTQK